ncbi:uncharacterized protein UDID_17498 [Ustilago sp. UG-2017a]|nr:uncharacterized protein UDID_17498 [Ustilago sp. UG-2017a]
MGTWEIMDVRPNTRLVNSKIVLRLKLDVNGIPVWHKARLVAQGFTQREGIDFEETFVPVAPLSAIRALLSLAVERNWEVHQLDITMAYLNSMLKHVIYMKPPEGTKVPKGKAYRVIKGLYGLKQLGQEWNMEFDKFLRCSNFHRLNCAPCIYTRGKGDNFAIVVIYVDDMLIIAPNLETVKCIKEEIGQRWRRVATSPTSLGSKSPGIEKRKPWTSSKPVMLSNYWMNTWTSTEESCHRPECSRSRRVTGSYGRSRSTGIEELVDTSRKHGRSAVSMEAMDSYGFTCKGGAGPYARRAHHKEDQAQGAGTATQRTKLKEQAQPRRGPSSRSMQMVTTQGLER